MSQFASNVFKKQKINNYCAMYTSVYLPFEVVIFMLIVYWKCRVFKFHFKLKKLSTSNTSTHDHVNYGPHFTQTSTALINFHISKNSFGKQKLSHSPCLYWKKTGTVSRVAVIKDNLSPSPPLNILRHIKLTKCEGQNSCALIHTLSSVQKKERQLSAKFINASFFITVIIIFHAVFVCLIAHPFTLSPAEAIRTPLCLEWERGVECHRPSPS